MGFRFNDQIIGTHACLALLILKDSDICDKHQNSGAGDWRSFPDSSRLKPIP